MTTRWWTVPEIARLRELHASGLIDREIADCLPGRTRGAISRKRNDLDLVPNLRRTWSPDDLDIAITLREVGTSYQDIADRLGRTVDAVRTLYRDLAKNISRGRVKKPKRGRPPRPRGPRPLTDAEASLALKDATIRAIMRFANDNEIDVDTAAYRLLSKGVA